MLRSLRAFLLAALSPSTSTAAAVAGFAGFAALPLLVVLPLVCRSVFFFAVSASAAKNSLSLNRDRSRPMMLARPY
jgi:hypothetical protein